MQAQEFDKAIELASVTAAVPLETPATVTLAAVVGLPAVPKHGVQLTLAVATSAAVSDDLLDVWVQTRISAVWYDVVNFAQITGEAADAAAQTHIVTKTLSLNAGFSQVVKATISNAYPAATDESRSVFGDAWRVRYLVTEGAGEGHGAAFTFKVWAREY